MPMYSGLSGETGGTYGTALTAFAPNSRIVFPITSFACGCCGKVTTMPPGRIIPAFSRAISVTVLPRKLLVIERDVGNHTEAWFDDVGRVQPPAHTYFQHGHLDFVLREIFECDGGEHLEKTWMPWQLAFLDQALCCSRYYTVQKVKSSSLISFGVDTDAFVDPHQMRRGVEAGPQARSPQNGGKRSCRRSFSVCSRN